MPIEDVGVENLPNVYIDKIRLTKEELKLICEVRLHMVDEMNDGVYSWFGRMGRDGSIELDLKIKVLALHSAPDFDYENVKELLDSGRASLFDFSDSNSQFYKLITINPQSPAYFDGTNYRGPFFKFIFDEPGQDTIENLSLYAATFLDDLFFPNPVFNKYYGPMTSENVLINGRVNQLSQYFYFPDTNEEYGGPVHVHDNIYMEGSQHVDTPHRVVRSVQIENSKIEFDEDDWEQ